MFIVQTLKDWIQRLPWAPKNILKSGLWCQVVKLFYFHKQPHVHMSLSVLMMLVSFGSESLNMFDVHLCCQLNHCCMLLIKSKVLGVLQGFRCNPVLKYGGESAKVTPVDPHCCLANSG